MDFATLFGAPGHGGQIPIEHFPVKVKIEDDGILLAITKYKEKFKELQEAQQLHQTLAFEAQALHARLFYDLRHRYPEVMDENNNFDAYRKEGNDYFYCSKPG